MTIEEAIVKVLAGDSRIEAAYLLGSAAQDRLRPDSDVDIAVLPTQGQRLGALERGLLAGMLSMELGRQADVGLLSSGNLVYARQAILTGHRVFVRDRYRADLTAATLLGLYDRFNEDRREVVNAYIA